MDILQRPETEAHAAADLLSKLRSALDKAAAGHSYGASEASLALKGLLQGEAAPSSFWQNLLAAGGAEEAGALARSILAAMRGPGVAKDRELCDQLVLLFAAAATSAPSIAAMVLGGALAALGGNGSPTGDAARCFLAWLRGGGPEGAVAALRNDSSLGEEAQEHCIQWLCALPDRLLPLCSQSAEAGQLLGQELGSSYVDRLLVAALDGGNSPALTALLARLTQRGGAPLLAARLCELAVRQAASPGDILRRLAEENPSASSSLASCILEACEPLVLVRTTEGREELVTVSAGSQPLLQALFGDGLESGPVRFLLGERLWRLRLGGQLGPAMVLGIVDLLRSCGKEHWGQLLRGWLSRWADPMDLKSGDVAQQRSLALCVVRALCGPGAPASMQLDGRATENVLRGISNRLSAQLEENRWLGMAVAEAIAERWPGRGSEPLRFENFDLSSCGLQYFRAAASPFLLLPLESEVFLPAAEAQSAAAKSLQQLLWPSVPAATFKIQEAAAEVDLVAVSSGPQDQAALADPLGLDSDDEDEDHPLRHLAPLTPLSTAPDTCSDLRLVQPPKFLRSGYEMLCGPAKVPAPLLTGAGTGNIPGSGPEPPATARARLATALATLPGLVRANPPELKQLAVPLARRLLRLDGAGVEDLLERRLAVLVSLLVADGSRSSAAQSLIADFATEDLTLVGRHLILEALAGAAKELSNRLEIDAATTPPPTPKTPVTPGRTRRFASATRVIPSKPNLFASELRRFLLPLVARWRQPDQGAARWAVGEPMLAAALLRCCGVLLECAGRASPDRDAAAADSVNLVLDGLTSPETQVRRCGLFLLSRILVAGGEEQVLQYPVILDLLEAAPLREADEICRKMAAGCLACLIQSATLLTPS